MTQARDGNANCEAQILPLSLQGVLSNDSAPNAVLLELHADKLEQYGYPGGAVAVLQQLYDLGYTDISHAGCVAQLTTVLLHGHLADSERHLCACLCLELHCHASAKLVLYATQSGQCTAVHIHSGSAQEWSMQCVSDQQLCQ